MLEASGIDVVIALICSLNSLLFVWLDLNLPVRCLYLGFQEILVDYRNVNTLVKLDGAGVQIVWQLCFSL